MKPRNFKGSPFLKPQTRKSFRKEARAGLRLAYGQAERGINKEIRGSRLAQKRNRQYFQNYQGEIGSAAERTAGAYSQAQDSIAQTSARAADYAETLRQRMTKEAQEDAARRGVPYDPSGSYTAADANLARTNSANVLSGVTGAQGASQAGMYADKGRIASRESVEQGLREQARRRALQSEKRDMAGDKAAQVAQMLAGARDSERDFYLGLRAAQEPGKNRRFESRQSNKSFQRQKRLAEIHDRNERADDRRSKKWLNQGGGGGGKDGGRPGSKKDRQRAMAYLRQGDYGGKNATRRRAFDYLVNRGVSPNVARWALRPRGGGGGTPSVGSGPHQHGG